MESPLYSSDEIDEYLGGMWYEDDGDDGGDETDDDDISQQLLPSSSVEALHIKLESTSSVISSSTNPEMASLQQLVSQIKEQGCLTDETPQLCAAIMNHPKLMESECLLKFTQISDASRYVKPNEITIGIYLPRRRLPRRDEFEWAQDSPILLALTQKISPFECGVDEVDTSNPTPNSKRGLHFCGRDTFITENVVMRYGQDKNRNIQGRQFQIVVPRVMKSETPIESVDLTTTPSIHFDESSAAGSIESVLQGLDRDHKIDLLLSILNEYQVRHATATQCHGGSSKRKGSLISLISPELTGSGCNSDLFVGCPDNDDDDTHDPHCKRMTRGGNTLLTLEQGSQLDSCILSAFQLDAEKNAAEEDLLVLEQQIKYVLKLFGAPVPEKDEGIKGENAASMIYNCRFRPTSMSPKVCRTESFSDSSSDSGDEERFQVMCPVLDWHSEKNIDEEDCEESLSECSEEADSHGEEEEDDDIQIMLKSIQITNHGHEDHKDSISTGTDRHVRQSKANDKPPKNEVMKAIKADLKKSDMAVKKGAKKAMKKLTKVFSKH